LVNQIIGENAKVLEKQYTQEYYLESFKSQQKEIKILTSYKRKRKTNNRS
jgi:hypothetical protein